MGAALVLDRDIAQELIRQRQERGIDQFDEVWEGVYVVSPLARLEHQFISSSLTYILTEVIHVPGLGRVYAGANVSDREVDWKDNFRVPDVVVVLNGSKARDCDTHLCGGPDFLVEVLSNDDKTYDKLDFYSVIGVRELLIVHPETRRIELFRLSQNELVLVGKSTQDSPIILTSAVVPLSFQWANVDGKPKILAQRTDGKAGKWSV
jgi:Uma2 family endonuclease